MSTTVDQRVVEMRFDNKQFESNVKTTMSTLEKLKQSLNLSGASKGLESVGAAAKRVDLSGVSAGTETLSAKFSALQVMGVTALANITNTAVNAGKRIAKALTIDPVTTGLKEYETQINAVQTILANTSSKGTTIDQVNAALDELNKYADKTIYNFTEMTRNIGTFTAAGVDLDTSVSAIQGIANLAAVSGSTSQQASTAMYQLSQALAAGTVKLQDWNSVVNAGMGGEVFQNALKRTATVMGTNVDALIEKYGSFRESLSKGEWLTTDVLTETLNQFTMAAEEGSEAWNNYKKSLMDKGYTEAQAVEILKMANTATDAATKVKTFTQLWDVLKESVQSGWAQTWELIIGDFEEAKALFTPMSDFLTGVINAMSDARNTLLGGALDPKGTWLGIVDKLEEAGLGKIKKVAETVGNVTEKLESFQKTVNKVWRGDFGNADTGRFELLEKAGYDSRVIQDLVNKGKDYKITTEDIEASHKKFGLTMDKNTKSTEKVTSAFGELSDKKLKDAGLTEAEIRLYRDLEKEAKKTGKTIDELVDEMSKNDGRTMLIDSLKNAGSGLVTVLKAIGSAWTEIFPPMSVVTLYSIIKSIKEFSKHLLVSDDTAEKITRTFKGLFAVLDIISTIAGGGLKIAFKVVSAILKYFNTDILSVTANIGDAIVKFRDWVDSIIDIDKVVGIVIPAIEKAIKVVKGWIDAFLKLPKVQNAIKKVKDAITGLKDLDLKEIGKNIIDGLVKGIGDEAKGIFDAMANIGKAIIESICEVLGINSPSTVMIVIGGFIIAGLIIGIQKQGDVLFASAKELLANFVGLFEKIDLSAAANTVRNAFSNMVTSVKSVDGTPIIETVKGWISKVVNFLKGIDWAAILAIGMGAGMLVGAFKFLKVLESFAHPFEAFGDMLESIGKAAGSFSKMIKAQAIYTIAKSLAILVGSLVLLTLVDHTKLASALGAITHLAIILFALGSAVGKWGPKEAMDLAKLALSIVGLGSALLLVAIALKQVAGMKAEDLVKGEVAILGLVGMLALLIKSTNLYKKDAGKVGLTLLLMSGAISLLVHVMKQVSEMEWGDLAKGGIVIGAFSALFMGLIACTNMFGNNGAHVGGTLIKMSLALILMMGVVTLASKLDPETLIKGGAATAALGTLVAGLIAATRLAGGNSLKKVGSTLLAMSIAMLLMVAVMKLVAGMSVEELAKGLIVVGALAAFIVGLIAATRLAGGSEANGYLKGLSKTLLTMAVTLGIMAGITALLGMLKIETLAKGLVAVGILSLILSTLIKSTRGVTSCVGNLIVITVALVLLVGAVALLSQIDGEKLISAGASLALVLAAFALVVKVGTVAKTSLKSMAIIILAVAMLGAVFGALTLLPMDGAIEKAIALSVLLLALAGATRILSMPGFVSADTLISVTVLTGIIGALGLILAALKDLPVESTIANAISLSVLLLALSGCCVILSAVGVSGTAGFIGVGVLATLIAGVGGLLIAIGALVTEVPKAKEFLDNGIPVLEQIGYAIGSFFGNIVGGFIDSAILDRLPVLGESLSGFMTNASGFIEGAKTVDESVLAGVGYLSGAIIALSAAEFIQGLSSIFSDGMSLATFGTDLSNFMTNASGFLDGIKSIDEGAATGAKALAETILALTASNVIDSIFSFSSNGDSLTNFANQLIPFGEAMVGFSSVVSGNIDESAVTAAASAGSIMAQLQSSLYGTEGVIQWFCGEKNLADFGVQLGSFGRSIVSFSRIVAGNIDESAVTAAASAGKVMAEMQAKIVPTGGVVQWFCGEKNMAEFGVQLRLFGSALVGFSRTVSAEGAINATAIEAAANAGALMTTLQEKVVPTGGVFEYFDGTKNLGTFGAQILAFGTAMANFSAAVSGKIDEGAVYAAANIGRVMASIQKVIPEDKWLDGKSNLNDFGKDISKFGGHIADFSSKVSGINADAAETVTATARKMVNIIRSTANLDTSGVDSFKSAIDKLASTNIEGFVKAFSVDTSKMTSIGSNMIQSIVKGITGSTSSLTSAATTVVGNLISAFSSKSSTLHSIGNELIGSLALGMSSRQVAVMTVVNATMTTAHAAINSKRALFQTAGVMLITGLAIGMSTASVKVSTAATTGIASALTTINGYYTSFYSAGSYLVDGFAAGISANAFKAEAKARAMARAALEAAEEELDENSPSKEFYRVGDFAGLGFVNALDSYASIAHKSGSEMASAARTGLQDAIGKLNDLVSSDMSLQPTIRPVVDLSDVKSSAGTIGDMLTFGSSSGILARVNSISTAMNRRGQNGTNDDVVSAINKLRKDIGNVGGTTYTVGNITYDDGSAMSQAVKGIVRAAKIERRV